MLLLSGCSTGAPPDENALAELISGYAVAHSRVAQGRSVVLDSSQLQELPDSIRWAITERLDRTGWPWTELDLAGEIERMPGAWEQTSEFNRVNQSHFLLEVRLSGHGTERELEWSHICGLMCGVGARYKLMWDGNTWLASEKEMIAY
jgi:hypothetical protein